MIKKIATLAVGIVCSTICVQAQSGAISLLPLQQDVRAAGMGGVLDAANNSGNIYSSPTDILYGTRGSVRGSALYGLMPSAKTGEGVSLLGGSVGFKMGKHALMVGARHFSLDKIDYVDATGTLRGRITPRETSLDLGYALRLSESFSAFARATYAQSYVGQTAKVLAGSLGVSYRTSIQTASPMSLHVSASLDNLGGQYKYGDGGGEYKLPSLVNASASLALLPRQALVLGARVGYYLSDEVGRSVALSAGAQYEVLKNAFLRAGYTTGRGVDAITCGAGVQLGAVGVDVSYEANSQSSFSVLRLGARFEL